MAKEEIKGVVTRHGDSTALSGRRFSWFTLSRGAGKSRIKVIGFYPEGIGPRCQGLEHVRKGFSLLVSGTSKGDVFFADSITKVARTFGMTNEGPPAARGPWRDTGIIVSYRIGKTKDWLEIVTAEGDQVPATMTSGLLDKSCLGKRFEFKGNVSQSGFRHGTEIHALEDA